MPFDWQSEKIVDMKLLSALFFIFAISGSALGLESEEPNVIFILTDNHGAWTLGCYGNPEIQTPNLDKMAAEGVQFMRGMANNPVCSPFPA